MPTTTIELTLPADQADLVQAAADAQGKTVSDLLASGQIVQGIVNDQAIQAVYRLSQKGKIPAELVTEAQDFAAKQVAQRKAMSA